MKTASVSKKQRKTRKSRHVFSKLFRFFFQLKEKSDPIIVISALILIFFGTIMIVSIQNGIGAETAANSLDSIDLGREVSLKQGLVTSSIFSTVSKQIVFIVLGYVIIAVLSRIFSFERWGLWRFNLIAVLLALLAATQIIGTEISGSRAWLVLGGFYLQPSELAKPATIVVYAYALYQYKRSRRHQRITFWQLFRGPLLFTSVVSILVVVQKDFGTLLIILGISLVCVLIPAIPSIRRAQRMILSFVMAGAILASLLLVFSEQTSQVFSRIPFLSHIAVRIENMKNPYTDVYGEGYQPANSLYGIGDAGVFGKGLGNSIRKYGYLTQSESDYILAVVIEETGIIGLLLITICTFLIIYRLFHYALKTKSNANRVVFGASAAYILLHFIINVGGVGGLIPMTGVPLLFISSGGSSLIAICITIGVCESLIAAMKNPVKEEESGDADKTKSIRAVPAGRRA